MNPTSHYIVNGIIWSAAGFIVGWLAGRISRDITRIARFTNAAAEEDTVPLSSTMAARLSRSYRLAVPILVVVLGIATAVQGAYQAAGLQRVSDCQTAYSSGFADALDARSSASADAQTALDALMTKVGGALEHSNVGSRAEVQQAVDDYLAARAKAKRTQEQNPYPPAPRDLCK
jgi:hypothetical protein